MLFNSFEFILFFPIVVALYFALPHRFRWVLLLAASYYFYMCWKAEYVILIAASTLIDYYAALGMGKASEKRRRRKYLVLSLITNLGLLFSFKYFNFFNESARALFDSINLMYGVPAFDVLLPVGISFYTFQTLSYTIDVYRGQKEPERHLGLFALYVSFFPQLVAGPIERSTRLLPQFLQEKRFDYNRVANGLTLMLWGFFKKIVIADRLAIYVNEVYNNAGDYSGVTLITATYFFAFQIYCDFSGYSDIAIGGARVLGFDLMENFRRPYFARSIADFWKRWHISLSTWFRDYLYISLGGNRVVKWRWHYNLLVVFVISGLWHGANWTFLAWGFLHGSFMIVSRWTYNLRSQLSQILGLDRRLKLQKYFRVIVTFHLVLFAWVFFRANNLSDAFLILRKMFVINVGTLGHDLAVGFNQAYDTLGWADLVIALGAIIVMELGHLIQRRQSLYEFLATKPTWQRWIAYYVVILGVVIAGVYEHAEFIYFQF